MAYLALTNSRGYKDHSSNQTLTSIVVVVLFCFSRKKKHGEKLTKPTISLADRPMHIHGNVDPFHLEWNSVYVHAVKGNHISEKQTHSSCWIHALVCYQPTLCKFAPILLGSGTWSSVLEEHDRVYNLGPWFKAQFCPLLSWCFCSSY